MWLLAVSQYNQPMDKNIKFSVCLWVLQERGRVTEKSEERRGHSNSIFKISRDINGLKYILVIYFCDGKW